MALNLGKNTPKNIFQHSSKFSQGLGKIRTGEQVLVANDGSGDYSDIQEAINSLPSTGGTIYIKEGIYEIEDMITIDKSNVQLIGEGYGSVLYTQKINFSSVDYGMVYLNGVSNTHIKNLRLKGTVGTLEDQRLLTMNAANYTIIDNCKFSPCRGSAIVCKTGTDCKRSKITNCEFTGIVSQILTLKNDEWLIQGNVFYDNTGGGAIALYDSSRTIISDNIIINGVIYLVKLSIDTNFNIVSNNILKYTTAGGATDLIYATDCENTIIIGNNLENTNGGGITLDANSLDTLVSGNIIKVNGTTITDNATDTLPNGATGTTNLAFDDLNIDA